MKKRNNEGFVLLETLIVTVFISSVLIFLFVQFNTLSSNYEESNKYNNVDKIYLLGNISRYIVEDTALYDEIKDSSTYVNLSGCDYFTYQAYCKDLLNRSNIDILLALPNKFDKNSIIGADDDVIEFINKINPTGKEKYRLIAKFKDGDFATIRFGEKNE